MQLCVELIVAAVAAVVVVAHKAGFAGDASVGEVQLNADFYCLVEVKWQVIKLEFHTRTLVLVVIIIAIAIIIIDRIRRDIDWYAVYRCDAPTHDISGRNTWGQQDCNVVVIHIADFGARDAALVGNSVAVVIAAEAAIIEVVAVAAETVKGRAFARPGDLLALATLVQEVKAP